MGLKKAKLLADLKDDCTNLYSLIVSRDKDLLAPLSGKIQSINKMVNIDSALLQCHSFLCELKFIECILDEGKSISFLDQNKALQKQIRISGSNLDFLVGGNNICEITSIKELEGFYEDVVCVDALKPRIIGRIKEKIIGDDGEGQVGKFLRLYPERKVNLVLYLPLSCDAETLRSSIVGDLACEFSPNGQISMIDTGHIAKENGTIIDPLRKSLITDYYEKVRLIFVFTDGKIYFVGKEGVNFQLKESNSMVEILI